MKHNNTISYYLLSASRQNTTLKTLELPYKRPNICSLSFCEMSLINVSVKLLRRLIHSPTKPIKGVC